MNPWLPVKYKNINHFDKTIWNLSVYIDCRVNMIWYAAVFILIKDLQKMIKIIDNSNLLKYAIHNTLVNFFSRVIQYSTIFIEIVFSYLCHVNFSVIHVPKRFFACCKEQINNTIVLPFRSTDGSCFMMYIIPRHYAFFPCSSWLTNCKYQSPVKCSS
jgi:hypothetical protein